MTMELPIQIVLASKSPRRVDLLTQLLDHEFGEGVVTFAIDPPNINETPLANETPIAHVQRLAVANLMQSQRVTTTRLSLLLPTQRLIWTAKYLDNQQTSMMLERC